jgi:hypothetical protein
MASKKLQMQGVNGTAVAAKTSLHSIGGRQTKQLA